MLAAIIDRLTRRVFPYQTTPIALLVLLGLSFGLMIPWLGFYWDDWPAIWYLHIKGPGVFPTAFAVDRPLLGWLFPLTTSLVGESIIAWQVFALATRWACCLALIWMLQGLWPDHLQEITWVVFLFAIYPGFQQQYIAVTYSHGWIILAAFFLSLGFMVWSQRKPSMSGWFLGISWLLSSLVMFTDEYFFGLELLRPVFLWMLLTKECSSWKKRLRRVVLTWIPFLLSMVAFLIWRLFLHDTPRGEVQLFNQLSSQPIPFVYRFIKTILQDMVETGVLAWGIPVQGLFQRGLDWRLLILAFAVSTITGLFTIYYLRNLRHRRAADPALEPVMNTQWGRQAMLLGLFSLFIAGWPFWATDLPIKLKFPIDRFTLPMMLGACFFLTGALVYLIRSRRVKIILLGFIVGFSAGMHFQTANRYRVDWNLQKEIFWQLAWRAPSIAPGTALLTADLPVSFYTDNSLTAPLNWVYAPSWSGDQMPYLMMDIRVRQEAGTLVLEPGALIEQPYRATTFRGSTDAVLVFYHHPPECLKVLDGQYDAERPGLPRPILQALPLSKLSLIQVKETIASPPEQIFNPPPRAGWCYYFEKAELAVQAEDWQTLAELIEQARLYLPESANPAEWAPIIEGYAHQGDFNQASQLSKQAIAQSPESIRVICNTWRRIQNWESASASAQTEVLIEQLECPSP